MERTYLAQVAVLIEHIIEDVGEGLCIVRTFDLLKREHSSNKFPSFVCTILSVTVFNERNGDGEIRILCTRCSSIEREMDEGVQVLEYRSTFIRDKNEREAYLQTLL
jgi:hypothetical protein